MSNPNLKGARTPYQIARDREFLRLHPVPDPAGMRDTLIQVVRGLGAHVDAATRNEDIAAEVSRVINLTEAEQWASRELRDWKARKERAEKELAAANRIIPALESAFHTMPKPLTHP